LFAIGFVIPVEQTFRIISRSREYLSEKEVTALVEAAASVGRHGARDAALILIAYCHGLRVSELVSLRWGSGRSSPSDPARRAT